ncbi:hypothetical protein FNV43_RR25094 [Rhamnella rubrinervis]|uniref:LRAT domain-containing protein n=1 Tax=Rhamnella rubrinervis TaxID=2594499 RepID=A0A8K0GQU9_9ROSA|nr:hypothetical protein FNV43_RR25094 [Rhamnella rubrinervis]
MGVLLNKIQKEQLKIGDHIYSWRRAYIYAHHGIYVGDEKVIHFTQAARQETGKRNMFDDVIFSSAPRSTFPGFHCPTCGDQSKLDGVISSCLDCFLSGGDLYRFKYGVDIDTFFAETLGRTCTVAFADPAEQVVHRASFLLENGGFGTYNVVKNNCIDFAVYCKTGLLVDAKFSVRKCVKVASSLLAATRTSIFSEGSTLQRVARTSIFSEGSTRKRVARTSIFSEGSTLQRLASTFTFCKGSPLESLSERYPNVMVIGGGLYDVSRLLSDVGFRHDSIRIAVEDLVNDQR